VWKSPLQLGEENPPSEIYPRETLEETAPKDLKFKSPPPKGGHPIRGLKKGELNP